jgi:hypothetical protein
MTDEKFQKLIDQTIKQKLRFFALLEKVENEYERRFGYNPSDVDDDNFIDTFHMPQNDAMDVATLTERAKNCKIRT